jgi:hypothetical protein
MPTTTRFAAAATLLVGALFTLGAQAFELRGFRGVHWGEGVDALRDVGPAQVDGDTELSRVRYCFHHDRLVMVMLDAPVARPAFAAEFQRTYGRPAVHTDRADVWGGVPSTTQAELVAQGAQAARLTLSVSRIEADAARRMVRLVDGLAAPDATPARVAAYRAR